MIYVIATINVNEGCRDAFVARFHDLMPLVRAEAGCLEYDLTGDVETNIGAQEPLRSETLTVVERWEDLDALEAHLIAPHMLQYRTDVADLVAGVSLQVLQPV